MDDMTIAMRKMAKEYRIKVPWWKRLLGYCPWCNRYFRHKVKTERRNTQYEKESSNWITACEECRYNDFEYFSELWEDYWNSRL